MRGWDEQGGALSFIFRRVEVRFGSEGATPFFTRDLGRKSDKVYTFFGFQKEKGVLCARSSSGMVTLLSK